MLAVDPRKSKVFCARSVALYFIPRNFPLGWRIDIYENVKTIQTQNQIRWRVQLVGLLDVRCLRKMTHVEPHIISYSEINEQLSRSVPIYCCIVQPDAAAVDRK
jgi:hypothetical protein